MKYVRRFLLLAVIIGYFLWPYHSVKKFAAAVDAGDSDTVASMIDAGAFADSMKDLVVEATIVATEDRAAGKPFDKEGMRSQLRRMMDGGSFSQMLAGQMTPETIARQMFAAKSSAASMGVTNSNSRTEKWVGLATFAVQEPGSEARAIFKFRGMGWKLAGLEVPAKEIRRYMPTGIPIR